MNRGAGRRSGTGLLLLLVLGIGPVLNACTAIPEEEESGDQPAVLEEVDGSDLPLVRFNEAAAQRVDLRTALVEATAQGTVVPYAALIYDPDGRVWVYVAEEPLLYLREQVDVDRIEGDQVWLRSGPDPGVQVVTQGAEEVYGTELGKAGEGE